MQSQLVVFEFLLLISARLGAARLSFYLSDMPGSCLFPFIRVVCRSVSSIRPWQSFLEIETSRSAARWKSWAGKNEIESRCADSGAWFLQAPIANSFLFYKLYMAVQI